MPTLGSASRLLSLWTLLASVQAHRCSPEDCFLPWAFPACSCLYFPLRSCVCIASPSHVLMTGTWLFFTSCNKLCDLFGKGQVWKFPRTPPASLVDTPSRWLAGCAMASTQALCLSISVHTSAVTLPGHFTACACGLGCWVTLSEACVCELWACAACASGLCLPPSAVASFPCHPPFSPGDLCQEDLWTVCSRLLSLDCFLLTGL